MSDIEVLRADITAPATQDDLAAPPKSLWQRSEASVLGIGGIVALLVAWEVLPHIFKMSEGTKLFFTTPSQVVGTLWNLFATGAIWAPLSVSASGFALGLAISIVIALPLGVVIGRSPTAAAMLDPFITAFNATPRLVFLPLVMLWFGLGLEAKIVIVVIGAINSPRSNATSKSSALVLLAVKRDTTSTSRSYSFSASGFPMKILPNAAQS